MRGLREGPARVKELVEMIGLGLGAGKFIMSMFPHNGRVPGSTRVCMCVLLNLVAFFPHLSHSLAQTVEDVFPCSLPTWRLHTEAQISVNLLCSASTRYMKHSRRQRINPPFLSLSLSLSVRKPIDYSYVS